MVAMTAAHDGVPLCLLTIHAHPDDEASKGSATVARYAAEGIRTVLVCCTGGEAGEVLNKAVDTPEVRANLAAVRANELKASVEAIGYSAFYLLGYHDSGMRGTDWNARPDNFHNSPLDEAVERLVRIIRSERPQVIVTYGPPGEGYGHPDHVKVFDISHPAFAAASDPAMYPQAGQPWQPLKLYYVGNIWSERRRGALGPIYEARAEESPFKRWEERRKERGLPDPGPDRVTTLIHVGDHLEKRRAALLAHRSQIDPSGPWMRLPDEILREVYPWDEFELAASHVDTALVDGELESDLFAGIRITHPSDPVAGSTGSKRVSR